MKREVNLSNLKATSLKRLAPVKNLTCFTDECIKHGTGEFPEVSSLVSFKAMA